MPKRKNPRKLDLTNEEIEKLVFPKKVRDAIHSIAHTDDDEPEPDPPIDPQTDSSQIAYHI